MNSHAGVNGALPNYAGVLHSQHVAESSLFAEMVRDLPRSPGGVVVDAPCGDGCHLPRLATLVAPHGTVFGIDRSPAYAIHARQSTCVADASATFTILEGDCQALPLDDAAVDIAWCANSMASLPAPTTALAELKRVVCPGGVVAIVENDSMHRILLPWPAEVEIAIREAELTAFRETTPRPGGRYIARGMTQLMQSVGLHSVGRKTYTKECTTPFITDVRDYLNLYLHELNDRIRPHVDAPMWRRVEPLHTPGTALFLLDQPGASVTFLETMFTGHVASDAATPCNVAPTRELRSNGSDPFAR